MDMHYPATLGRFVRSKPSLSSTMSPSTGSAASSTGFAICSTRCRPADDPRHHKIIHLIAWLDVEWQAAD